MRAVDVLKQIDLSPGKLRDVRWRDIGIRFAFGVAISMIAATLGLLLHVRLGGMFLAFPAILPATITLISDKEDREQATRNVQGAIAGGVGLVAFAVIGAATVAHWEPFFALLVALGGWVIAAVAAYLLLDLTLFADDPKH